MTTASAAAQDLASIWSAGGRLGSAETTKPWAATRFAVQTLGKAALRLSRATSHMRHATKHKQLAPP